MLLVMRLCSALTPLLFLFLLAPPALAADASKPHEHQGVIKPYQGAPPAVPLTAADKAKLEQGKPVMKTFEEGEAGGRGVAIFRVNAPPEVVWSVIRDFSRYPEWIDNVEKARIYHQKGDHIDVHFELSALGFSVEYFIAHRCGQTGDARWLTWTLDYAKQSDLDDSVGFWRVTPVEGKPDVTQVEYSVDLRVKGWVPGFIKSLLVNKGLKEATQWVRVQAEKRHAAAEKAKGS